ncbi:MAG: recombinase family protein, partial [Acidimicrobiales bacterium]
GDLERQLARLVEVATAAGLAPTKVVTEVGSGLNGSRSKLKALLRDPAVGVIVVEHRDRLARHRAEKALLAAAASEGRAA